MRRIWTILLAQWYNFIYVSERLSWLQHKEETREGKHIFRKTSQGTNAIVLAKDGEMSSYINDVETKTGGQIEEIFRNGTGLGHKQEILFSKIHVLEDFLWLSSASEGIESVKRRVCAHQNLSSSFPEPWYRHLDTIASCLNSPEIFWEPERASNMIIPSQGQTMSLMYLLLGLRSGQETTVWRRCG